MAMRRQAAGCNAGTARAYGHGPQGLVEAAARRPRNGRPNNRGRCKITQAKGRLQRWNSKGLRPEGEQQRLQRWNSKGLQEGLVEAAARESHHFRGFKF